MQTAKKRKWILYGNLVSFLKNVFTTITIMLLITSTFAVHLIDLRFQAGESCVPDAEIL